VICTFKNSFEIYKGHLKDKIICPIGLQFNYISHEHFYHAYYEIHTYKVLFHHKAEPIEMSMKRVHCSNNFIIEYIKKTHSDDNKRICWNDVFEEECPISVN